MSYKIATGWGGGGKGDCEGDPLTPLAPLNLLKGTPDSPIKANFWFVTNTENFLEN